MSAELLLSRLDHPKPAGRDRWRAACPVCGESNKSTLSIGVGDSGCTLVRCWKNGCGPDQIAAAVGLRIEDLFPPRSSTSGPMKRRRMLPASQALELLEDEMTLTVVVMSDMRRGVVPDDVTAGRMLLGLARVIELRDEARS